VSSSLRAKTLREIKENMGQCKSNDQDLKSYANAVFSHGFCCVSASLRTETLRENMGQWKSEGQDFKRDKRKQGTVQI
jgi:hypothetical protein